MLALKHFRDKAKGTADLLNPAALFSESIVGDHAVTDDDSLILGKDGSLLAGWFFRGPDSQSSTPAELNYVTARINAALTRLGTGFVLWTDAVRVPAADYPAQHASYFPDPVTTAIDEERRKQFLAEDAHFETDYALLIMYTPPLRRNTKIVDLLYDDDPASAPANPGAGQILAFKRVLADLEDGLFDILKLKRMKSYRVRDRNGRSHLYDELVNYLHFCVTGHITPIQIPPCAMYLDAYLGGQELWTGDTPKIGDKFITAIAIEGFPHASFPSMLSMLEGLPIAFRFSARWIALDQHEAASELRKYRRKWQQWVRGFWSQVFKTEGGTINEDAALMARQSENALTDANSNLVAFGYYTPVLILMGENRELLLEQARTIARETRKEGFATRVETVNALEAYLGSIPHHVQPNIRRPLIHSVNFADLFPAASTWPGLAYNPNPLFPPNSPPLMVAATTGSTPFRLNLHVDDVGHTLIFGPTGAGKSTLLSLIAAQFRRYPNANITVFDKGRSMLTLAYATGGRHYDLGGDGNSPGLCPLAVLDYESDRLFAEEWIATCFELQTDAAPSPKQRQDIHRAIELMASMREGRSLTDFVSTVQDAEIRSALSAYTIEGPLGRLLDSRSDGIEAASFKVFEIEELMALGQKNLIPILLYLFRQFERSLTGEPALLLLDEAWIMLGHPTFRDKIREWLKVLRKANCAVVLATQSLSDAARSGILDVLLESCPTRILLPNEEADKGGQGQILGPRDFYAMIGLNETEIGILKSSIKKRHYYYTSPLGRRLFELGLGPVALAFTAVSSREDVAHVRNFMERYGENWPAAWLADRGIDPIILNFQGAADV